MRSADDQLLCLKCPLEDCNEHSPRCLINISRAGRPRDPRGRPTTMTVAVVESIPPLAQRLRHLPPAERAALRAMGLKKYIHLADVTPRRSFLNKRRRRLALEKLDAE